MRFQFTLTGEVRVHRPRHARGAARLLGRARLKPHRTSSSLVTTYTVIARYRSFIVCVCALAVVHSSTSPCSRVRARARERVYAHTRDDGGDSRGQARRRRRLARSSSTTATTTVNEIVESVSANYRAVPGVHGASLRSYLPSCVVTRKGVASGREKSAITPTRRSHTVHGSRNRSNPGEFDSQCRGGWLATVVATVTGNDTVRNNKLKRNLVHPIGGWEQR